MANTVNGCAASAGGPTPGGSVVPVICSGSPGTLRIDEVSPFSYTTSSGTNTGTIESAVYNDGGTLDFYYQVTNDLISTGSPLTRMAAMDFTGVTTDAGFRFDGSTLTGTTFVAGTVSPITADSDVTGTMIGFNFPLGSGIGPGTVSNVLVISTDATRFTFGAVTISDGEGGSQTVASFQPAASPVPEPSQLIGLAMGIVAIIGVRRVRT